MLYYKKYHTNDSHEWVTFIHGAGGSSSVWFRQIREFKKHYNVLLIDLRGHGNSKQELMRVKLSEYTFNDLAQDVINVLDHLHIKKSHFVGISLGTVIVRVLAENNPDRVLSMVLGGAVLKLNFRSQFLMKIGYWLKSVIPFLWLYKFFAWIILPRKNHKESRNIFIQEAKRLYQKEFIRWFKLAAQINPLLKLHREKASQIRTLYIMGEEDYMFLPSIKSVVENSQQGLLRVIPNCGHVVNVEKPEIFNQFALEFFGVQTRQPMNS